jgi:hypothetical protein
MERANGWLTEFILILVVITLFLMAGYLLAHAESGEMSKTVFYVH